MTELYQHQKDFLALNPNKSSLVWSCGTGKTRTAIEWLMQDYGGCGVIVCPKALKQNWRRELMKYWRTGLPGVIKVMSKEEFRRDWDKIPKDKWTTQQIIVDEVHNGFLTPNFKSQMSKALKGYLKKHNVPRVLLLSATVYTSSPWNIYNLAYYTGHIWNWRQFESAFFNRIRMGARLIPVAKKGTEPRLVAAVKRIASVVDIKDCMDIPEQLHCDPEYFALSKEQLKAIKDNYDPLPIVRYTKQHEIENGILVGTEFSESKTFESDKTERLFQLVEENKKIAIVCRYNAQIDYLTREFHMNLPDRRLAVIRGDVKNRDELVREAEMLDDCIVIIQGDCGVGFELPSFELCIFTSMSYSYTSWEQMTGRFLRMNKPSRTIFMYLLTEGESIDQAVYDAVKRKEDFRIQLYNKN